MQTPQQLVRAINLHCDKGNGIYTTAGRCFRARVCQGVVQVTPDFGESWIAVGSTMRFWDSNGRRIGNLPSRD